LSSTAFTQCAPETTEFGEITQNKGHYAVQGHSRSPILVTKISIAPFWMQAINVLKSFSNHGFMIHLIIKIIKITIRISRFANQLELELAKTKCQLIRIRISIFAN